MAEAHEDNGDIGKALATWGTIATLAGLASDILQPLGPIALYSLIVLGAATLIFFALGLVGRNARFRRWGAVGGVGAAVFGLTVLLQQMTGAQEAGFIAKAVPSVAAVQDSVLGASPARETQQAEAPAPAPAAAPAQVQPSAVDAALSAQDPVARLAAAQAALADPNPSLRQAAIMRFYDSGDAVLRRQAVIAILASRTSGQGFTIAVIDSPDNDAAMVNATRIALLIASADPNTGAVAGSWGNSSVTGSVSMGSVNLNTGNAIFALRAEDGYVLRGSVNASGYGTAQIEIPLM